MPAVVRAPGVARTLLWSLLARVPVGALGLLIVLQVRHLGHSYVLAGACGGAFALGITIGAPLLGRASDRIGQLPILLASGAAAVASAVAFALLPTGSPNAAFLGTAAAFGITQPPVTACARVLWRRRLDPSTLTVLLTLDASLQEVALIAGPLILVGFAGLVGPAAAMIAAAMLLGGATVAFALLPETRTCGIAQRGRADADADLRSPLKVPGVRTLLGVCGLQGFAFGAIELTLVRFAESHDASGAAGLLFACWGFGSLIGGILWSRRSQRLPPETVAVLLLGFLAVSSTALVATADIWALSLMLVVSGLGLAPLFGLLHSLMSIIAPEQALNEAFAWKTSALTAGLALGSTATGALAGLSGFLVAGGASLLALCIVVLRRETLTSAEQHAALQGNVR